MPCGTPVQQLETSCGVSGGQQASISCGTSGAYGSSLGVCGTTGETLGLARTSSSYNVCGPASAPVADAILASRAPLDIRESEVVQASGQTGIYANKTDAINWCGPLPINQYPINEDLNPEIITKRMDQCITYDQEIGIRYLQPPTPPSPGEIIIREDRACAVPPAPPLVIRQQPVRPETPVPLVLREAPPRPPPPMGQKIVTVNGKRVPPPPRKVIIERLPAIPCKPQSIIVERWLPFPQMKRKVIFQKSPGEPLMSKPKNVIIQWEAPCATTRKLIKHMGTCIANPAEYVQRFAGELRQPCELPDYIKEIKNPDGIPLAADVPASKILVEGDLYALNFVDLDRAGLSELKPCVPPKSHIPSALQPSYSVCGQTYQTSSSQILGTSSASQGYMQQPAYGVCETTTTQVQPQMICGTLAQPQYQEQYMQQPSSVICGTTQLQPQATTICGSGQYMQQPSSVVYGTTQLQPQATTVCGSGQYMQQPSSAICGTSSLPQSQTLCGTSHGC